MNADPDEYACYLTDRKPPIGVPLAIYAESTDGFSEWFEGDFDGAHWRAFDLPARPPEWYVRGWREVLAPFGRDGATVDCRKFTDPPTTRDPLLVSAVDES
jgi:hypothetical protein